MKTWFEQAEAASEEIFQKTMQLPFIKGLIDGTLTEDKFLFYIKQDSMYISAYLQVLAHCASRLPEQSQRTAYLNFATAGIAIETYLHESYLKDADVSGISISPDCQLYNCWHKSHAYDPVEVEAAGILPCFTVYRRVGMEIKRLAVANNPYSRWIDTYADPDFADMCKLNSDICDRLAENASPEVREAMTKAFVEGSKLEWLFWHSAWQKRQWEV